MDIDNVFAMADRLTEERIASIAEAYRACGRPHSRYATCAADIAGRKSQVAEAAWTMTKYVQMYGITYDGDAEDVRCAAWAGNNVAVGVMTEDLIGTVMYSMDEYASLVDPWFRGFGATEGERAA